VRPGLAVPAGALAGVALGVFATGSGDENGGYRVRAIFDNAAFVIPGMDVRIGGVVVGSIASIDLTDDKKATVVLQDSAPANDREAIAHDQRQNAEYTGKMAQAAEGAGLPALAAVLEKARLSMAAAARMLDKWPAVKAVPNEEAALGSLVDAAKLLEEAKESLAAAAEGEGKLAFTLSQPKPKGSKANSENEKDSAKQQEALRKLMEEVQRQLAEQQKLNQDKGEASELSKQQQGLAQDAQSAASQAQGMKPSADGRGDPKSAAKELERAAGLEQDNAEALASGDAQASKRLGTQSEEALAKALHELAAQMGSRVAESEAYPPGYERLVGDYLRSISYE